MDKLQKLINFDFFENTKLTNSICDGEMEYINKHKKILHYEYNKLNKSDVSYLYNGKLNSVNKPFISIELANYANKIEKLSEKDLSKTIKIKKILPKSKQYSLKKLVAFELNNYFLLFIDIIVRKTQNRISMVGIIKKDNFIFVGSSNERYFIHCDKFSYTDHRGLADGEGYLESFRQKKIYLENHNPKKILRALHYNLNYVIRCSVSYQKIIRFITVYVCYFSSSEYSEPETIGIYSTKEKALKETINYIQIEYFLDNEWKQEKANIIKTLTKTNNYYVKMMEMTLTLFEK